MGRYKSGVFTSSVDVEENNYLVAKVLTSSIGGKLVLNGVEQPSIMIYDYTSSSVHGHNYSVLATEDIYSYIMCDISNIDNVFMAVDENTATIMEMYCI